MVSDSAMPRFPSPLPRLVRRTAEVLGAFGIASAVFAAQDHSVVARESLSLVRADHAHQVMVPSEENVPAEVSPETVLMESVVITESIKQRDLHAKIERESQKLKAEQFSITRGGVLYQKGALQIGSWGDKAGVGILKFSW